MNADHSKGSFYMRLAKWFRVAPLALIAVAGGALVWSSTQRAGALEVRQDDEEKVITLDKAPAAVRDAALKLAGDAKHITKVIAEEDEDDVVTYEIEYNQEGPDKAMAACTAVLSENGDVMELEHPTTPEKLPAAAMEALRKEFPNAKFSDPQIVTKTYYEIDVVIDGKTQEVKVDASGDVEDDNDSDQDHGQEKDNEKDKD